MSAELADATTRETRQQGLDQASRATPLAVAVVLVVVLGLGLALCFAHIESVGFRISDEAMYARHGRFFYQMPFLTLTELQLGSGRAEREEIGRLRSVAREIIVRWNQHSEDFYNKPTFGHAGWTAAAMFVLGRPADYAPYLVSAFFGWAILLVVFLMAQELFGTWAGLYATSFLAVSRYWLFYSRSALAEADSVFFLTLGLWWYFRSQKRRPSEARDLAVAGFFFGVGALCHYRWLMLFPVFLALEWLFGAHGERRRRIRPVVLGLASYAVPFLIAEIPFYFMMLIANLAELPLIHIHGYFTNLAEVYLKSHQAGLNPSALYVYPFYYVANDGALPGLACLAGLGVAWRMQGAGRHSLLRYLAALFILLVLQRNHVGRSFSAALPCLAILAGAGLVWASETLHNRVPIPRRWFTACGLVLVLALGLVHSLPLLSAHSGVPDAVAFLIGKGARKIVVPNAEFARTAYNFYGGSFVVAEAAAQPEITALARGGFGWMVFDRGAYQSDAALLELWQLIRARLTARSQPAFAAPPGAADWMNYCFEASLPFRETWVRWRRYRENPPATVEIFDLKALADLREPATQSSASEPKGTGLMPARLRK